MGKSSTDQTQQQTQSSQTQPWANAVPLLDKGIAGLSGQSTDVTGAQSAGLSNLTNAASNLPTFDTSGSIDKMLGFDTAPQMGMLSDAYNSMKGSVSGLADPTNLDPMKTPGFSDALGTMTNDITNQVKSVYAGSGRDPSGAGSFAQSLGRGLTQGEAPVIAAQYNANVGHLKDAAGAIENGGINTSNAMTSAQAAPLSEAAQAIGLIPQVQNSSLSPAQAQLTAANTGYQLPYSNILQMLQPALSLGALGQSTNGSSTTTTSQPQSAASNIMGGLMGGVGMLSQMGAFTGGAAGGGTGLAAMLPLMLSDERAKEDVEEIGKLHDGQTVHRFRYKGDPVMRMGLLAQEVMEHEPGAVHEMPTGLLMVDHARATERAAHMRRAA